MYYQNLFPQEAEAAVNKNFESAMRDNEPFHSWSQSQ
jgi:hypothetical protein